MNIGSRLIGLVLLCLSFLGGDAAAQAIFNPKIGMETWSYKDEKEVSDQSKHPGQMIGFGICMEDKRFLFEPGFEYHRISLLNEDQRFSFDLSEHHHVHYFMMPLTAGYKLTTDALVNLAVLGGGEVVFFYDVDDNDLSFVAESFYGVSTNLTAVFQAVFNSWLSAEIKYHYGLQPTLKMRDDSKLRGWTLDMGVRF